MKESHLGDLSKNVAALETKSNEAKAKLKSALENLEKLKSDFTVERATLESKKTAWQKRTEDAEKQLKPVAEELAGLKQQICRMTAAIFGKCKKLTLH